MKSAPEVSLLLATKDALPARIACDASTVASEDDDGSQTSASILTDCLDACGGSCGDTASLLASALNKNAEFLTKVPNLTGTHLTKLRECKLGAEEMLAREESVGMINTRIHVVSNTALELYGKTIDLIEARKVDITTLDTLKRRAERKNVEGEGLLALAQDAIEKLKKNGADDKSAGVAAILHQFQEESQELQEMCKQEAAEVRRALAAKEAELETLQRERQASEDMAAKAEEASHAASREEEMWRAREAQRLEEQRLREEEERQSSFWRRVAFGVAGGILGGGAVAVGVAFVASLALAPITLGGSVAVIAVGAGAGAAAGVLGGAIVGAAALSDQRSRTADAQEIVQQLAHDQERGRLVAEKSQRDQRISMYKAQIQNFKLQEGILEKHMETLQDFENLFQTMSDNLKKADCQASAMMKFLLFFDKKTASAIQGLKSEEEDADEEDKEDAIRAYIAHNLKEQTFNHWSKNLDLLEESNQKLIEAVAKAFSSI